jgi:hypothetical protein
MLPAAGLDFPAPYGDGPCRLWVKTGKSRSEQMFSGLPPIADIAQRGWHGRKVPRPAMAPSVRLRK